MADVKLSALPTAASVATSDILPIVDAGTTKQATVAQVRAAIVPISLTADVSGTLPAANGGTGATSLPAGGLAGITAMNAGDAASVSTAGTNASAAITAERTATATLTGKTIAAGSNTITGLANAAIATGAAIAVAKLAPSGTNGWVLTTTGGVPVWAAPTGGSGSPGGTSGQMQFNNASAFGGADMSYVSGTGYTIATNNTFLYGTDTGAATHKLAGIDNSNYYTFAGGYIQHLSGGDDFILSSVYGQIMRGGFLTPMALADGTSGLTAGLFEYNANLNATYSNSTTSATATNLSFSAAASEVWDIVVEGLITTATGGIQFQLNAPTGATVTGYLITCSTAYNAFTSAAWTTTNAKQPAVGATAGTYYFRVSLTLTTSATPGSVAFAAAGAAASTNQILAGTKMIIKRTVKV